LSNASRDARLTTRSCDGRVNQISRDTTAEPNVRPAYEGESVEQQGTRDIDGDKLNEKVKETENRPNPRESNQEILFI
jgi:hypothetical protein